MTEAQLRQRIATAADREELECIAIAIMKAAVELVDTYPDTYNDLIKGYGWIKTRATELDITLHLDHLFLRACCS